MTMKSTKKREYYLMDLFDVHHIDDVPKPQEVIRNILEEENFQDRREEIKADRCLKCGSRESLVLINPKRKDKDYRFFRTFKDLHYKICNDLYQNSNNGDKNDKASKKNRYILENWGEIKEQFEEELKAFKESYKDLENWVTVCESCNTLIYNYNLYLCQNCKENFHPAHYYKCWDCTKEDQGLELCPICRKKYYNPSKFNKCKICRE